MRQVGTTVIVISGLIVVGGLMAAEPVAVVRNKDRVQIAIPKTVFRDVPATLQDAAKRPFRDLMLKLTRLDGDVRLLDDAMLVARQLDRGEIDLGVFQGHEFAWAKTQFPDLLPLVVAQQLGHGPVNGIILVRADNESKSMTDLRGKVASIPLGTKDHVRLFFEKTILEAGGCNFGQTLNPQVIHDGVDDIIDRKADVTIIDSGSWESYKVLNKYRHKKVRPLAVSDTFPTGVIACRKDSISKELQDQFQSSLLNANRDTQGQFLLRMLKLRGFDKVTPEFEKQLLNCAKNYPLPDAMRVSTDIKP